MINDREHSVQQLASKLIYEHLVQPLLGETTELTWRLLNKIEQQDNHRLDWWSVKALFIGVYW